MRINTRYEIKQNISMKGIVNRIQTESCLRKGILRGSFDELVKKIPISDGSKGVIDSSRLDTADKTILKRIFGKIEGVTIDALKKVYRDNLTRQAEEQYNGVNARITRTISDGTVRAIQLTGVHNEEKAAEIMGLERITNKKEVARVMDLARTKRAEEAARALGLGKSEIQAVYKRKEDCELLNQKGIGATYYVWNPETKSMEFALYRWMSN